MNLLKVSLICSTLIATTSCGFDIQKLHPHFLDTKRGYARIYEFKEVPKNQCGDPGFTPEYSGKNEPIENMSGYVCFKPEEIQHAYKHYLESLKKNCPEN